MGLLSFLNKLRKIVINLLTITINSDKIKNEGRKTGKRDHKLDFEKENLKRIVGLLQEALQLFPVGCSSLKEDLVWIAEQAEELLEELGQGRPRCFDMYIDDGWEDGI